MKEYMEKLMTENSDELQQLQNRMNYLMEEWRKQNAVVEKILRHTRRDENIFSPRTANIIDEEKILIEKNKENSIKQEIEYVREKIETLIIKQEEYETVIRGMKEKELNEKKIVIEEIENAGKQIDDNDTANDVHNDADKKDYTINIENAINNIVDKMQDISEVPAEEEKSERNQANEKNLEKEYLCNVLSEVVKSVDVSLALLNGDKNKCRSELKKIKKTLKECLEEIK